MLSRVPTFISFLCLGTGNVHFEIVKMYLLQLCLFVLPIQYLDFALAAQSFFHFPFQIF